MTPCSSSSTRPRGCGRERVTGLRRRGGARKVREAVAMELSSLVLVRSPAGVTSAGEVRLATHETVLETAAKSGATNPALLRHLSHRPSRLCKFPGLGGGT
jgi:hypothetical protein